MIRKGNLLVLRLVLLLVFASQCYTLEEFNLFSLEEPQLQEMTDCSSVDCNPDQYLTVPQIIRRHGYPSETHTVQTTDGYLLGVHRIPGSKSGQIGGQPVFLQHGLLGSSADWILNGNSSLAFQLADLGYDVWLGNARGNRYSRAHISLSTSSQQFWDFSWHEMGTHDLPAVLYHVSNTTNKMGEIIYIGHSMGTTMFFVFSSLCPQAAKNIKLMVALAPAAFMSHIKSPIRYFTPFVNDLEWLTKFLGIKEFLPNNKIMKMLAFDCELLNKDTSICENIVFAIGGFNKNTFNKDILPLVISHDPAGTSTKTVLHYAQEIHNKGQFQPWDYGTNGNMAKYGQPTPPPYNLTAIKRPIYIMFAQNDVLADPMDVKRLSQNLSFLVDIYQVPDDAFDHVDFIFGKDADRLVNQPLIKLLQKYKDDN